MKRGVGESHEFRLLLTQYVSSEILFGGKEFGKVFASMVKKDPSMRQSVGAPSVFILTSEQDAVYAGPNRPSGIALNDEFKQQLIAGIQKNGGLRTPSSGKSPERRSIPKAALAKARRQFKKGETVLAALAIAPYVQPSNADELKELQELTGLTIANATSDAELNELVTELGGDAGPIIDAFVKTNGQKKDNGKHLLSAVKLAKLQRAFGNFPGVSSKLEAAWSELIAGSDVADLQQQATMIDKAREAETEKKTSVAIGAYRAVVTKYPETDAAKLCELRISQLSKRTERKPRTWTSKSGGFSVTATLLSFDGTTATLRTKDGKNVKVPMASLSKADQDVLRDYAKDK